MDIQRYKVDPAKSATERGQTLIRNHNRKVDEIAAAMEYGDIRHLCGMVTMTEHSPKSKMANKHSLSCNVRLNTHCQARQCLKCRADGAEPVCRYCFANAICNARPAVDYSTARNSMILQNVVIQPEIWREVWAAKFERWGEPDFRIESLSDVQNVTQSDNYVNLEYGIGDSVRFTGWSKNPKIWHNTFERLGKPKNSNYIHSSLYLNIMDEIPVFMRKYVDFRFTVFTVEYLREHPEIIPNCCTLDNKGRKCRYDCNDCYSRCPKECAFDRIEIVRGYHGGKKSR